MSSRTTESNKVLKYSIIFSTSFSVIALIFGFLTSSQVILFDGIFNLIGVVLTYLSILSMKFMKKEDIRNYPFGKENFEPFIVISQYCIILFVSISNIVNAIQAILDGGRDMDIGAGIIYGLFSFVFSLGGFMYLKHLAKSLPSSIEEVEIEQWKFGYLFSLAILIGFSIGWILTKTPLAPYIVYLDPVLTIVITIVFIRTAILSIRNSVRELLIATPSEELTSLITEKINHINSQYHLSNMVLRLGKVGGQIVIELDYIIEEGSEFDSIRAQEELRAEVDNSLKEIPYDKWLNVNFIGDIKWAR